MSIETMGMVAGIIGAICWFVAYILIIRRGFLEMVCGMPVATLCANICWEFTFSFIYPETACNAATGVPDLGYNPLARGISPGAAGQEIVNIIWFVLDILIVVTYLRFGRRDFTPLLPQNFFLPTFIIGLVMSLVIVSTSVVEFDDCEGIYTAFAMNLLMSILFPITLLQRGNVRGQSFYIAAMKMIGTAGFSLHFYAVYPTDAFLNSQYLFILAFDIVYTYMVFRQCVKEGINPLTRF